MKSANKRTLKIKSCDDAITITYLDVRNFKQNVKFYVELKELNFLKNFKDDVTEKANQSV